MKQYSKVPGYPCLQMDEQSMDTGYEQACTDLQKATQCITLALQHEAGRNRELCVLIRRLEEKEAETRRSLSEQVEANKQLQLKIDELQKHLEEKDHLLTQANQQIKSDSSVVQSEQWVTAEEFLMGPESVVSSDTLSLLVSQIKEENTAGHVYEEYSKLDPVDHQTGQTVSSLADVKPEEDETLLASSNSQKALGAPISEEDDDDDVGGGGGGGDGDDDDEEYTDKSHFSHLGKTFARTDNLIGHRRSHTGERPYHCTQCGKSFAHQNKLTAHQRIHTGERPYRCTQCGKSFRHQNTLNAHRRSHTGERPYRCTQCGKSFLYNHNLKAHQSIHTGVRPYACSQCGKTFSRKGHLDGHLATHTRQKPHRCTQCGKSFRREDYLKRHQRSHTGSEAAPLHSV